MATPYCRHIKTNGRRCCSLAMRGKSLCYFHSGINARHRALQPPVDATPTIIHPMQNDPGYFQRNPLEAEYYGIKPQGPLVLDFPVIEDRESIQVALSMLIAALGQNRLDAKHAGAILYGLQVASGNVKNLLDRQDHIVLETTLDDSGHELAPDEDPDEIVEFNEWLAEHEEEEDEEEEEEEEDEGKNCYQVLYEKEREEHDITRKEFQAAQKALFKKSESLNETPLEA